MSTILSRIILPQQDNKKQSQLYYRPNKKVQLDQGALKIFQGSSVRFNTYFNGFFYPKYLAYSCVSEVSIHIRITGAVKAKAICQTKNQGEFVLYVVQGCGLDQQIQLPAIRLETLPQDGMLFLEVEAVSGTAVFHAGWYETNDRPKHAVHVAAVICTYRREQYVLKNLERLIFSVWEDESCPIRNDFDVLVVDNGSSLHLEDSPHVHLFPNRNYGGSGGFTRGIIEVYKRQDFYTHVLLMDDDISFEPEVLVKTIQLLRFVKELERPVWIGGQMLIEDQPTIQFEAGAFYRRGRMEAVNRGLDLSEPEALLFNEQEHHVQYNAWWYCCIPIGSVKQKGFPLPMFIKADDVEYSLRNTPHVLLMNGIGIWHMAFSQKYSPHLEYYIKRNELIVSAIHGSGDGIRLSIWKLIRAAGKALLVGNPVTVDFLIWAYQDFLKGPDFFLNVDDERLNSKLLERNQGQSKSRMRSLFTDPFRLLAISVKLLLYYSSTKQAFALRASELTSLSFWSHRLGLE